MAKVFVPQVVTANRLQVGDVVYLGAEARWVMDLSKAAIALSPAELSAMETAAQLAVDEQQVVGVYAIDVDATTGVAEARSVKERIRAARGPSV